MTFDPNEYKSIFTSKTFWGAVVMLVATLFPAVFAHFGAQPDSVTQSGVVDKILTAVGFIFTVWGRFSASQSVSVSGNAPTAP